VDLSRADSRERRNTWKNAQIADISSRTAVERAIALFRTAMSAGTAAVPILKRTKADSERRNTYETMSGM
jgi:hypothetical protein